MAQRPHRITIDIDGEKIEGVEVECPGCTQLVQIGIEPMVIIHAFPNCVRYDQIIDTADSYVAYVREARLKLKARKTN